MYTLFCKTNNEGAFEKYIQSILSKNIASYGCFKQTRKVDLVKMQICPDFAHLPNCTSLQVPCIMHLKNNSLCIDNIMNMIWYVINPEQNFAIKSFILTYLTNLSDIIKKIAFFNFATFNHK